MSVIQASSLPTRAIQKFSDPSECLSSKIISKICCIALAIISAVAGLSLLGLFPLPPVALAGLLLSIPFLACGAFYGAPTRKSSFNELDLMTDQVSRLQAEATRLRQGGNNKGADDLCRRAEELEKRALELNASVPYLTRYDLMGISKFFSPPLKIYEEIDGIFYLAPDSSELIRLITSQCQQLGYVGYGAFKKRRAIHPSTKELTPCDFVYCRKSSHQADIHKQMEFAVKTLGPILCENYARWKYSGYLVCKEPQDFLGLGGTFQCNSEDASAVHGIALFYQKATSSLI